MFSEFEFTLFEDPEYPEIARPGPVTITLDGTVALPDCIWKATIRIELEFTMDMVGPDSMEIEGGTIDGQ